MSVSDWFSTFCRNLQVSNDATISLRYRAITKRLNLDFWNTDSETSHSLYVGSYGRNTAIHGFSDVDIVFQIPIDQFSRYNDYVGNGQSALLQAVRTSVLKTYSNTEIGADGQVVVVKFTDGMRLEIVPGFLVLDNSYTYPDSNNGGSWKSTNPRAEIAAIRQRNSECNGNLIPLCRMLRAWRRKWDVNMGGLHIDTLAYQFIATWSYRDKSYLYYDYLARDIFAWMAAIDTSKTYWLAPGSGSYVYKKGAFQAKAKACHELTLAAIEHQVKDRPIPAKNKWREIFGSDFPS